MNQKETIKLYTVQWQWATSVGEMSVGAKATVQCCNGKAKAVKVEPKKYNEALIYMYILWLLLSVVVDYCIGFRKRGQS